MLQVLHCRRQFLENYRPWQYSDDVKQLCLKIYLNCNFSCSEWLCRIPKMSGCNLQYAVMEGCYFRPNLIDCDWKYGQIIGAYFDEFIFERCDLREIRWSSGAWIGAEIYRSPGWIIIYRDTFDSEGVFRSEIDCPLPDPNDPIPF